MKILCVEDEPDFREDLVEFLRELDCQVLEAANGRDGLALTLAHSPDLIICDRGMPEMSGVELLRTLRDQHPECGHIPFVYLTAMADRRDRHATAELEPAGYLTKPLDFEDLEALIAGLAGSAPSGHAGPSEPSES